MCFSAAASFGVGAALLPTSAYCMNIALRRNRRFVPLALVPAMFGLQQMCEGLVWLGLDQRNERWIVLGSLSYLFFAFSFWPFWIPLCALWMETRGAQRRVLLTITGLGAAWFLVMAGPLLWNPAYLTGTRIEGHSIHYDVGGLPILRIVSPEGLKVLYAFFVFIPFVFGTHKQFLVFGILLGTAAVVSQLIFTHAFVSVWCFFAAFLSLYLCVIFAKACVPAEAQAADVKGRQISGAFLSDPLSPGNGGVS